MSKVRQNIPLTLFVCTVSNILKENALMTVFRLCQIIQKKKPRKEKSRKKNLERKKSRNGKSRKEKI